MTAGLFHFSLFSPHNIETFRLLTDILKYVKDTYSPQVTVEDHLRFVEVLQPDVFECLCDSSPSIGNKPKRVGKSVDRTLRFLDETVEARASNKVRRSACLAHRQLVSYSNPAPSFPGPPWLQFLSNQELEMGRPGNKAIEPVELRK